MCSNQAFRTYTEKEPADNHGLIALKMGSNGDKALKEGDGEDKYDKAFINLKKVDEVANEEGAEYVREGEDRVEELELFFSNM